MITEFNVNGIIECYLSDSTKPLRASQQNPSQAELKMRIQALGETAVKIANIADIII